MGEMTISVLIFGSVLEWAETWW